MSAARAAILAALFLAISVAPADAIIIRAELTPELDEVDVPVFTKTKTWIITPYQIVGYSGGDGRDYRIEQTTPRRLEIDVADGALPSNLNIEMSGGHLVSLRMYMTTDDVKAASRVELYKPGTMPVAFDGMDPAAGEIITYATRIDLPKSVHWRVDGHRLTLDTNFALHGSTSVIPLHLRSDYAYTVTKLEVRDPLGRPVDAQIVYGTDPAIEPTEIGPGRDLRATLQVLQPQQIADGWTLVATSSPGVAPAQFVLASDYLREDGPLEKKLAVAVHVLAGTSNVVDGAGNDDSAWTSLQGIGARVTYGVSRRMSIEGALEFTRTGEATFADATWGQDLGELRVRGTSGRILAGGLLHTAGKRWVPYARAAFGVQVSRYRLTMGSRQESEIRSGALLGFGGGLKVMLARTVMADLTLGYVGSLTGAGGENFEAGLSLAALWDL